MLTVKVFEVPVLLEAVAVIESVPAFINVTDWLANTPATNDEDVVGEIPANKLVRATVEANEVTVLLSTSCATILILKAVPTV